MIKAETSAQMNSHTRILKCQIKGSLMDITSDTLYILRQIYRQIASEQTIGAAMFAAAIEDAINGKHDFELWSLEDPPGTVKIGTKVKGGGPS